MQSVVLSALDALVNAVGSAQPLVSVVDLPVPERQGRGPRAHLEPRLSL